MPPFSLQPGDIILSSKPTIWGKPIQWLTGSKWTHVGIYAGMDRIIHALWPDGVCYRELSTVDMWSAWRVPGITTAQRAVVMEYVESKLGAKYDLKQFFLLGVRIALGKMTEWTDDPNEDEFVCSELVAEAYHRIGIHFGLYKENILPGHIAESDKTIFLYSSS